MINFVFFGTPDPAVEIFEQLYSAGFLPKFVVTNPDKPQGRKMALQSSPVKKWALSHNLICLEPTNLNDSVFLEKIKSSSTDIFIVVAYGGIFSKEFLEIPKYGSLNVHYSLLPKYRGASPVESQILNDDKDVGVSIMLLAEKMDHGPIVKSEKLKVESLKEWPPTATNLRTICNNVASKLLIEIIPLWIKKGIKAKEQDHIQATYTKKIKTEDREIKLLENDYKNFLKFQAFEAWGTYFFEEKNGKKIRVLIKTAEFKDGKFIPVKVIPEGKKEMGYEDFLRGVKSVKS